MGGKANELFVSRKLSPTLMMKEGSQAKDFKQSACWEATQPNQIRFDFLFLFLILNF